MPAIISETTLQFYQIFASYKNYKNSGTSER